MRGHFSASYSLSCASLFSSLFRPSFFYDNERRGHVLVESLLFTEFPATFVLGPSHQVCVSLAQGSRFNGKRPNTCELVKRTWSVPHQQKSEPAYCLAAYLSIVPAKLRGGMPTPVVITISRYIHERHLQETLLGCTCSLLTYHWVNSCRAGEPLVIHATAAQRAIGANR